MGSWASSPPRSATRPIDRQPSSPSQVTTPESSVRSIPGAHAVSALDSVSDLLTAHGGHPAAAGFQPARRQARRIRARTVRLGCSSRRGG